MGDMPHLVHFKIFWASYGQFNRFRSINWTTKNSMVPIELCGFLKKKWKSYDYEPN